MTYFSKHLWVYPSCIPILKVTAGLDPGLGLFNMGQRQTQHIAPGTMLAILSWGATEEDPTNFTGLYENEGVVHVRRKGGKHSALYQRGANFLAGDEEGAVYEEAEEGCNLEILGWMANSPSEPDMCNAVAISACAGKDHWFSFLLSVKTIKNGQEIVSNALPFDPLWAQSI